MFKKLFGGGDKPAKKEQPKAPEVPKDVQAEKIIFNLDQQINKMTDQTNKLENEADLLTQKAKELMANQKKKEAKQVVNELNDVKKKIQLLNTRKKVLRTQKNSLEVARMDIDMTTEMDAANKFMKEMEAVNDKMSDILLDTKEIKANMEETDRMMKELAGGEQEDQQTDDLFKELESEVNKEQAAKITANLNTNPTITTKKVQPIKQSQTSTVDDDLSKWLN